MYNKYGFFMLKAYEKFTNIAFDSLNFDIFREKSKENTIL